MEIMELGAIGELVGGVAVIASLLYVGLQVRQNTVLLKRSNSVMGINLVRAEDRFFLTDHPSDDLEIAIVEASLNKR